MSLDEHIIFNRIFLIVICKLWPCIYLFIYFLTFLNIFQKQYRGCFDDVCPYKMGILVSSVLEVFFPSAFSKQQEHI